MRANLPSRADFRVLGERLDGIESQLAELRSLLLGQAAAARGEPASEAPKPARTRKPPKPEAKP